MHGLRLNDPVSVVIPTTRPQNMDKVVGQLFLNSGIDREQIEIVSEIDHNRIGCPKMTNHLVERTKHDLVLFFMDDAYAEKDMIKNALLACDRLPDGWGLVGLNDHYNNGDALATAWMGDKRLLPYLDGKFLHEGYRHACTDNEIVCRCHQLGRYVFAEDAGFIHDHPVLKGIRPIDTDDEVYKFGYRPDIYYRDRRLFIRRLKNGWVS